MALHVCSLKFDATTDGGPQSIPAGDTYTVLRFPYGSSQESWDPDDMHAQKQGGADHPFPSDPASGLIWPKHDGPWAHLYGMVQWEGGSATEYRDQFARDPLGTPDTTCTEHHAATPGMQCFAKSWAFFVHTNVPIGLRVAHNAGGPLNVVLAEFKLEYDA